MLILSIPLYLAIPAYHRAPSHVNNSAYFPVARPRENLQVSYPGASGGNGILLIFSVFFFNLFFLNHLFR